jgi:peptidoglycan/xylan/chitin deacetylase (PgdA/CDA1 family)
MRPLDLVIHALSSRVARPLFRRIMRGRSTVFMLHRVEDPATEVHGHSLAFLREALTSLRSSGAKFVSVRQIVEAYQSGTGPGDDWVAFTIDDGFADQGELARTFTALHCPVTIFLISGFLDHQIWPWDDRISYALRRSTCETVDLALGERRLSVDLRIPHQRHRALEEIREYCKTTSNQHLYAKVDDIARQLGVELPHEAPPEFRPLSWDEARTLERCGVDFAPHSVTHRIFSQLSEDEARTEINESWRRLQAELHRPLPVFAWPTGRSADYSARDVALLRQAGLTAYATTDADYAYLGRRASDLLAPYGLRRFSLPNRMRDVLQYGSWIERGKQIARRTLGSSR